MRDESAFVRFVGWVIHTLLLRCNGMDDVMDFQIYPLPGILYSLLIIMLYRCTWYSSSIYGSTSKYL